MADGANGSDSGYRPSPVSPDGFFQWPDWFGRRFTVCVDTEEEFDWNAPFDRKQRMTTAIQALPGEHMRFAEADVPLIYLIDHPVATDPRAVDTLGLLIEDGVSAIGTQLHPWVNPPFDEKVSVHNSFVGNLPKELEAAKLDILTGEINRAFGKPPRIFRAGRYGLGRSSLKLLAQRGYRIDTSMRARYDYSAEGGPDYRAIGNRPFWTDSACQLLELPFTTIFTGRLRKRGVTLFDRVSSIPRGRGLLARTGMLSRISLTPEAMPIDDVLEAIRVADGEGTAFLNFAFHSPTVVPGHTPYVRDQADLHAFHLWWKRVFVLLDQLGYRPAGQNDLLAAIEPD